MNSSSHTQALLRLGLTLWERFGRRVIRYGLVGTSIAVSYSLAIAAAVNLLPSLRPTTASILAFFCILPFTYLAHRGVTFSDRDHDRLEPLRFSVTTVSSFALSIGGMYWITEVLGQSYLLGIAWNWVVVPCVNFTIFIIWVFRERHQRKGPECRAR